MQYRVIQDTQEQQGWTFKQSTSCLGMERVKLPTGDYTLEGYENILTIERKADTGEFSRNINEGRFERELIRMEAFKYAFMILEFTMSDIMKFPVGSGIPAQHWSKLRVKPYYMLMRLVEFDVKYKTKIILAGGHGKDVASSIFKRVIENELKAV